MPEVDVARLRTKRAKIKRLANNESATEPERENALRRIAELDERIAEVERTQVRHLETVDCPELGFEIDENGNMAFATDGEINIETDESWRKPAGWPTRMGSMGGDEMRRGVARMKRKLRAVYKNGRYGDWWLVPYAR